jgi:hypothetical protein
MYANYYPDGIISDMFNNMSASIKITWELREIILDSTNHIVFGVAALQDVTFTELIRKLCENKKK